ncbi:threonylcarbamoyladenylate synthase Ecym_6113 [Eremothecium cymbalariae DBVPG|uniref:Threonylcarbamoyl-AMP synthase n=1 Tax=Eremothecium cymbalariae (strain CBS 270.75 / DBVPG 7215 / KCTC 17166 / NRRL Y-17582) TaxID=931890 RepID=G8JV28_ERECY|nr:hypothetical protein Ecym_6113 [Eremothecium cymbalariae DBVPG\
MGSYFSSTIRPSINFRNMSLYNTRILKVDPSSIHFPPRSHIDGSLPVISDPETERNLLEAARIISVGGDVVAFPTETVYGLGGSSLNNDSVLKIYKAKNRPSDNPLISHVSSIRQLNRKIYNDECEENVLRHIPAIYHILIDKSWPGPLTILLPVSDSSPLSKFITAGQPTFAVRIPANPVARALIALSDTPIAAPSANASTRPSPTLAEHVYHDLEGKIPLILDGGACSVGVESTVIDGLVNPPMLLRPGGFTYEQVLSVGGPEWSQCKVESRKVVAAGETVRTPGMKYKHYSPKALTVLFVPEHSDVSMEQRLLKVKNNMKNHVEHYANGKVKKVGLLTSNRFPINLIEFMQDDIKVIAASLGTCKKDIQCNLFALLRKLDEQDEVDIIFVEGIEEWEEGLAIMNRLHKAAGDHIIPF